MKNRKSIDNFGKNRLTHKTVDFQKITVNLCKFATIAAIMMFIYHGSRLV